MVAHALGHVRISGRKSRLGVEKSYLPYPLALALLFATIMQWGCSGTAGASNASVSSSGLNSSTSSLSFGNVNVNTTKSLIVTFTNTSGSTVTVSSVTINQGPGFSLGGISNGLNLAAGMSAAMTVSFAPAATGPVTGSITVVHTASSSPITISLSGSGASGASGHTATLSWNASSSSNVVGYYIYRAPASGQYSSKLNSSPNQTTTFVDSSVLSGQTYYYVVTAIDVNMMESFYSNEVSASIP